PLPISVRPVPRAPAAAHARRDRESLTLQFRTMYASIRWIIWNLFLAAIPVALGYLAAWLGARATHKSSRVIWLVLAPVLLLWLIFLPNSCYLFTESRHLLQAVEHESLWTRARHEPAVAMRLAFGSAVALLYSSAGALTFALAIRP